MLSRWMPVLCSNLWGEWSACEMQQRACPPWLGWPSADPLLLSFCCSVHHGLHLQPAVFPCAAGWQLAGIFSELHLVLDMPMLGKSRLNLCFKCCTQGPSSRTLLRWVPDFRLQLDAIRTGGMSKKLEQTEFSFSAWLFVGSDSKEVWLLDTCFFHLLWQGRQGRMCLFLELNIQRPWSVESLPFGS